MNPSLHLRVAGVLQVMLALLHFAIPRILGWPEELMRLSLLTRQVFWVHTGFIMLTLVLFGLVSLCCSKELLQPGKLQRSVLGGMLVFWGTRLACQFFVYDPSIWRGHGFYTVGHIGFSGLWIYLTASYWSALRHNWRPERF